MPRLFLNLVCTTLMDPRGPVWCVSKLFSVQFWILTKSRFVCKKSKFPANLSDWWVLKRCETLEEADAYAPVPDSVDGPLIPPIITELCQMRKNYQMRKFCKVL